MKRFESTFRQAIPPSELVLNGDGSVYHLALKPHQIANTVIVVGDPGRVKRISSRFSKIDHKVENREFFTHTGMYNGMPISALSTGIGTDNIDIVMNELDALRHINLNTRVPNVELNPLRIVRLGTSGALHADISPGSFVHSNYAVGLDGVLHFYDLPFEKDEIELVEEFVKNTGWNLSGLRPYAVRNDLALGALFQKDFHQGITVTSCGFYGPQGRVLRLPVAMPEFNQRMSDFSFRQIPLANYEMESSALFGLGAALGHACTTVCVVVANRIQNAFLPDHHEAIDMLIDVVLERLSVQ